MPVNVNTILIIVGFLFLFYLLSNSHSVVPVSSTTSVNDTIIERPVSNWSNIDELYPDGNGGTEGTTVYKGVVPPWTDDKKVSEDGTVTVGGPGYRDSNSQLKQQDELYPNYYDQYETYSSDYYPWWKNQHFWPYYTRSHNWMYRYPYYSSWRKPYYYNYWATPYYPSKSVLVKPYLRTKDRKATLKNKLEADFRRAKINDSPVST
jgi:hypothetical protein